MKLYNSIGWCDATTNAVTGCDKVSPGCKNCYAAQGTPARVLRAKGIETWGLQGVRHPVAGYKAVMRRLNKLCVCDKCRDTFPADKVGSVDLECGGTLRRPRLFADSNSDWLDLKWPVNLFRDFMIEIAMAENVDVLLLTKRMHNFKTRMWQVLNQGVPQRFHEWFYFWVDGPLAPPNVWLGVSVEDQQRADERVPQLLQVPAKVHFLSCEPLLAPVDLLSVKSTAWPKLKGRPALWDIDWVIIGLESGPGRRDSKNGVADLVHVASQCFVHKVPVYVKQVLALKSGQRGRIPDAVWARKEMPVC